mmetsp:Transcript_5579/g.11733  ORF Transcript_5579/g.11733 Transcript_5579/m.11733 type:complete len:165 (-) Transcript_5579:589-1083(-)
MDLILGDLGIPQNLLAGIHALLEVVHTEILETGTGDGGVEIDTIEEGINLDVCLGGAGQGALGTLAGSAETTQGTLVLGHVLAVAALEVLEEVVDHAVVEVLSSQVSVSCGGFNLEDSLLNCQERHVEGSSSEIEDEHILLLALLVEAVSDGGGGGLVDDAKHV